MYTKEQIIGQNQISKQDKINLFESLLLSTKRQGVNELLDFIRKSDFYTAPASTKYHSHYEGGLLDHSLIVYITACGFADKMKDIDPNVALNFPDDSIIITSLLHDFCKVYMYKPAQKYRKDEYDRWEAYDGYNIEDTFPIGHGEKSIIMLQTLGFDLNPCEMLAIRYHMGFWHGGTENDAIASQINATKMCPLVVLLQLADFSASMVFEEK